MAASAAESLFDDGRALMVQGRFDEACAKFEESQRLDPGGGTILNLARCYEGQGRLATSWVTYRDAQSAATRDGRADRLEFARDRLAVLEPRIPRIAFRLPTQTPGLDLYLDDVKLGAVASGKGVAVDPGNHRIRAQAPGRIAYRLEAVARERQTTTVYIPDLRSLPVVDPLGQPDRGANSLWRRRAMWVLGSSGAAGVAAGGVAGLLALRNESSANAACPGSGPCNDPGALQATDRAHTYSTVAMVTMATGGACLVAGVILWLTAPSASHPKRASFANVFDGIVVQF